MAITTITLSNNTVAEGQPNGYLIGNFTVNDPLATIELLDSSNHRFVLDSADLLVADTTLIDFEAQPLIPIEVAAKITQPIKLIEVTDTKLQITTTTPHALTSSDVVWVSIFNGITYNTRYDVYDIIDPNTVILKVSTLFTTTSDITANIELIEKLLTLTIDTETATTLNVNDTIGISYTVYYDKPFDASNPYTVKTINGSKLTTELLVSDSTVLLSNAFGTLYTDYLRQSFDINVTDGSELAPVILSISPRASKIQTHPQITLTGSHFDEGGSPVVRVNGIPAYIDSNTDTEIKFTLTTDLTYGIYDVVVANGYQYITYNLDNADNFTTYSDDLTHVELIRYMNDEAVSFAIGNNKCYVKPTLQLVYDVDGISGKFGKVMNVIPSNPYMTYIQVYLKHNANFDWNTGGLVSLDSIDLIDGDLVWLSNQTVSADNGIYIVRSSTWEFLQDVTSDTFVDLGARATDQVDGNINRNIIIDHNINFGISGFYSITYYVINSLGILSTATRKVKILGASASITPIDSYKITDYKIISEVDPDLLINGVYSSEHQDACCPTQSDTEPPASSTIYIKKDGSVSYTANQSMDNHRITNLENPIYDGDAVNLGTVKTLISNINGSITSYTAGEHIYKYQIVYINTDGKIYSASSSNLLSMGKILGVALTEQLTDELIDVIGYGKIANFSTSLSVGVMYYLNNYGYLSITPPTTGFIQIIGTAVSSTQMLIQMQTPIQLES